MEIIAATVVLFISTMVCGINMQRRLPELCIEQINSCACRTESGYINLAPLDLAKSKGIAKYRKIEDIYDNFYDYNPCTGFSVGGCLDTAICQFWRESYHQSGSSLGSQQSAKFQNKFHNKTTNVTKLEYNHYEGHKYQKSANIRLWCNPIVEGEFKPEELTGNVYPIEFILTTKYACSDIAPVPDELLWISPSKIILIVFFSGVLLYLVCGVLYKVFFTKERGLNLIPHVEFWTALPGLARDGCMFVWRNLTVICNRTDRYQSLNQPDATDSLSTVDKGNI